MPELPEVELMTRAMDRWTRGRALRALVPRDTRLLQVAAGVDPASVQDPSGAGLVAHGARRRAKYTLLDLGPLHLVLHFRMTGRLVALDQGEPERPGTRLRLDLEGPGPAAVTLVDPRRLGQAWLLPSQALPAWLEGLDLGPEPWPEPRDGAWWAARLAGLRAPLKVALMRQDRVAGLGNICATEALWRAGIDPRLPVALVSPAQWQALARAVPALVAHVLQVEGPLHDQHGELRYVNEGGTNPFSVYGRQGQPCPRCGGTVERLVQAGRGTAWCPRCQAAPACLAGAAQPSRPERRSRARTRSSSSSGSKGLGR